MRKKVGLGLRAYPDGSVTYGAKTPVIHQAKNRYGTRIELARTSRKKRISVGDRLIYSRNGNDFPLEVISIGVGEPLVVQDA